MGGAVPSLLAPGAAHRGRTGCLQALIIHHPPTDPTTRIKQHPVNRVHGANCTYSQPVGVLARYPPTPHLCNTPLHEPNSRGLPSYGTSRCRSEWPDSEVPSYGSLRCRSEWPDLDTHSFIHIHSFFLFASSRRFGGAWRSAMQEEGGGKEGRRSRMCSGKI